MKSPALSEPAESALNPSIAIVVSPAVWEPLTDIVVVSDPCASLILGGIIVNVSFCPFCLVMKASIGANSALVKYVYLHH